MSKEDDVMSLVEEADGSQPEEDVEMDVRHSLLFHEGEPVLIAEGETKVFKLEFDSIPYLVPDDGDEEFRAFAVDAEGRFVRGNKDRFFKKALERGWKPKPRDPDRTFNSSAVKILPNSKLKRLGWKWKYR